MAKLQLREALRRAMVEEMRRDERVFLMGEEVAYYDGAYKVSQGMLAEFGDKRIIDTPIAENGFTGIAIGAAMAGLRPIVEMMTWNFSLVAYDQIINSAAKIVQMTAGQYQVPIVIRGANGAAEGLGSQHSQALESIYAHFPGLKVISTATPADAYGLLKSAIRDPNPVIFMESELAYGTKGEVPDEEYLIPIGKADLKRDGTDVTLVTWNKQVYNCLTAADELAKHGISAQVLDLRTIRPLDEQALFDAINKTHRMVVVQEGFPFAGVASEIVTRVQETCFDALDAPILRVTNRDINQPYAPHLEKMVLPSVERIVDAARTVCGR
ncbi:MAG: pyruvate dehydrogenase complex E1 component subunit beta [Deltaproteobacteria bacterium]|nr:MAG: pyruvate dehydrogenase complex E1 component subunit beta [Deltaproteobacteria bacterium]